MKSLSYSKQNIKNIFNYSDIVDHKLYYNRSSILKKQNYDVKNFHFFFVPVDKNIECFDVSKKSFKRSLLCHSHGVNKQL